MCKMVVVAQLVRAPDCGSGGRSVLLDRSSTTFDKKIVQPEIFLQFI